MTIYMFRLSDAVQTISIRGLPCERCRWCPTKLVLPWRRTDPCHTDGGQKGRGMFMAECPAWVTTHLINLYHRMTKCGVCGLFKTVVILLMVAVLCFFAEEYVTFGMWDAHEYRQRVGCSEEIYNFKPSSSASLFTDVNLLEACGVHNKTAPAIPDSVKRFDGSNRTRLVKTKCGTRNAQLVSYYVEMNKDDLSAPKLVPNVVHYVSFGIREFTFLKYLSFKSASVFIKPTSIFIHGDGLPYGDWWKRTTKEVPNIYLVERQKPTRVQGKLVRWVEHSSDIMRLQTILDNGGIYLDMDIIVLKSFDPLRGYEMTLGRETSYGLGSGIIIARPQAPFVCVWFNTFRNYNPFPWNWAYYAVHTPHLLAKVIPDRIHIEETSLQRPSWNEPRLLFEETVDWSDKYAVHVWKRFGSVPRDPAQLESAHNTLGGIMRYVYYYKDGD